MSIQNKQRIVIGMMDGFDMEYFENTEMSVLRSMANSGFFKEVSGVFPSVTNVNNVSICCGTWPEKHGITANSYFDESTGKAEYMNSANMIEVDTIFKRAALQGVKSSMLTCKRKTLELFHDNIEIGIAAEDASQEYKNRYGEPASIYSREINYWLWEVTADLLKTRPDIGVFYVHITDYPMHAWGPEHVESQKHLQTLDTLIGEVRDAAPDAAFFFTADHGMNYKKRCWDLKRVCEERGSPVRFVLSPERDYYVKHHRNFTGCSWIWLNNPDDIGKVTEILQGLEGVEEIISKEEAASRFHLKSERIGDLTVTGDQDTMFGEMETAYEDLPPTYRAHGSFYEMRLPLIIWNYHGELPPADEFRVNFDLTRMLYR